jgi:nifR3 family TIM-barrel protein
MNNENSDILKQRGPFGTDLQKKINQLMLKRTEIKLGSISFDSPLLLAPMSAICSAPFRLLMEELGTGGTVSELVSCHGINHGNERTKNMLFIDPREKNCGLQLFGEDEDAMAKAAKVAEESGPKFIDINMGCPVRKVVSKGGGSALLKDTSKLGSFFKLMKDSIDVPLTIKVRTGWDDDSINAEEVAHIAFNEGVEFVAVHGRTRTQQYKGSANWEYLEKLAQKSKLPIIGNGDLHSAKLTKMRMESTNCPALMLGRGPLRDPFIFLTSYLDNPSDSPFHALDYLEVIMRYHELLGAYVNKERTHFIQMRKMIVWFLAGFDGVSEFRNVLFTSKNLEEVMSATTLFLTQLHERKRDFKQINLENPFMMGGHG